MCKGFYVGSFCTSCGSTRVKRSYGVSKRWCLSKTWFICFLKILTNALMEATTVMKMLSVQILMAHSTVVVNLVILGMVLTVKVSYPDISTVCTIIKREGGNA